MQAKVPSSPGGLQVAGICATLGGRDSNCSGFIGSGCQSRHPTQSVTSRDVRNPLVGLGQGLFKVEKEGSQYIISVASIAGCIIVLLLSIPVWGISRHFWPEATWRQARTFGASSLMTSLNSKSLWISVSRTWSPGSSLLCCGFQPQWELWRTKTSSHSPRWVEPVYFYGASTPLDEPVYFYWLLDCCQWPVSLVATWKTTDWKIKDASFQVR